MRVQTMYAFWFTTNRINSGANHASHKTTAAYDFAATTSTICFLCVRDLGPCPAPAPI